MKAARTSLRKLFFILSLVCFGSVGVSSVHADWVFVGGTMGGSKQHLIGYSMENYKQFRNDYGEFTGYELNDSLLELSVDRPWYVERDGKGLVINITFFNGEQGFWVHLYHSACQVAWNTLGFMSTINLAAAWGLLGANYSLADTYYCNTQWGDTFPNMRLWVTVSGSMIHFTVTTPQNPNEHNKDYGLLDVDLELSASWHENVTILYSVEQYGMGSFDAHVYDVIHNDTWYADIPSFEFEGKSYKNMFDVIWRGLTQGFSKVLPDWMMGVIEGARSWFLTFSLVLSTVWISISILLPMLGLGLFLYFLDAVVSSWNSGSFRPVGDVVTTIYGLASGVVGVLVTLAQTLYDFIHFW